MQHLKQTLKVLKYIFDHLKKRKRKRRLNALQTSVLLHKIQLHFTCFFVLSFKILCYCFSICLEWNGLGILETSFAAFCDGLAANSALRALDLRNNQINHEGAEELSAALKRNITLRALGMSTICL